MKAKKKEINIQIGNRLQTVRKNIRYTQEAFAETLGISVEHYRKLESGVYALQLEKMLLLYKTYKIDPTYLITGEKEESFNMERFLAKCSIEEREDFIDQMFVYMRRMMSHH